MTPNQQVLSRIAKTVFHLNGRFVAIGENLARPAGLTAARWQVLGTVLGTPMSVADVARELGLTRQSVQRVADILVEQGLAVYRPNPAHRRAKLLNPTEEGRQAVRRIAPAHAALAERLAQKLGPEEFPRIADTLNDLAVLLDTLEITDQPD